MNKTLRKFSVLILSGAILAACGDDDDKNSTTNIEPEFPTEFSDKTVEQNKSELQDNGIDLVNKLTTLKSSSGIQTSIAFSEHVDGATLPESIGGRVASNSGVSLLQTLAEFGKGNATPGKVIDGMRINADDEVSASEIYDALKGTFTYSAGNNAWTFAQGGDKIIFKFPSTKTGTANNAEYALYDFKSAQVTNTIDGQTYTNEYPTNLKADLTVDGTKKMEYSFSVTYDSKGNPTNLTTSLKIDTFTFAYALTNTTTEAKLDYSLTEGSTVLFAVGARGKGSFTVGDVADDTDDVVANASAYFQILNVKFSGELDADALRTAVKAAKTEQQVADAYNANYKLTVFYADSKKKIADGEFYVGKESSEDLVCTSGDGNHDGVISPGEKICQWTMVEKDALEVRMVFADGSKADLETYTSVGFADLQTQLEKFVDSIQ